MATGSNLPEPDAREVFDNAVFELRKDGARPKEVRGRDSEILSLLILSLPDRERHYYGDIPWEL